MGGLVTLEYFRKEAIFGGLKEEREDAGAEEERLGLSGIGEGEVEGNMSPDGKGKAGGDLGKVEG